MADDHTLLTSALPDPSGPALPTLTSPAKPAVAPELDTPMRPWEQMAQPGVFAAAQASRREERYGAPLVPVGRAAAAVALLAAAIAAGVRSVLAFWDRRALVLGLDGDLANADPAALGAADDAIADAALVTLVATVAAGVAVILWTYRAYRTIAAWRPIELRLRWAVLGWVVPVVNLIVPLRILTEITAGSSRGGHGRRLPLVWWVLWTAPLIGTIALRNIDPVSAEGWVAWDTVAAAMTACTVFAGTALIAIIVRSTSDQRERLAEERMLSSVGS